MTDHNRHQDPTPDPDEPDYDDPLTADDILARADKPDGGGSQATRIVALANGHFRLLRGEDGRLYAARHEGPSIAFPLRGRQGLRKRLASLYHHSFGTAPAGSALTDALTVLEGQAETAPPEPVGLRVAAIGEQSIALDLAREDGRCVIVDPTGWRLTHRCPVLFRRTNLTSELPEPATGGSLDQLRGLLNVDESQFRLVVAWLVAALLPDLPHPILVLSGEQGTAKSTAARLVVSLVDPSPAPLRTAPRDKHSWAVAATASWLVALDNLSSIPDWLSDTLCRAVTGDGFLDRALYTDDDVSVLAFRRCIALTTIDAGRLAGDLADRMLTVELARIPATRRRPDAHIAATYKAAHPQLLGALLDLAGRVLDVLPSITPDGLPRMADFARILVAVDRVQGCDTLGTYAAASAEATQAVLESDPVAAAILALVAVDGTWQGTTGELLELLTPDRRPHGWPESPRALAGRLKRLAPALRDRGITYEHQTRGASRLITLRRADRPGS